VKVKKKRDKTWSILKKAWEIQSEGLRREGKCAGCGSIKNLVAGHLVHDGRGKAWNRVDFNVNLPALNVWPQCSYCNTYSPDGNGLLRAAFDRKYFNADELYQSLRAMKQVVWKPDETVAMEILELTRKMYAE
jgi:hypothetical protein